MIFIEGKLTFKPYLHKKTLSQGTLCRLQNGDLIVIDSNDWENSETMSELNYYCFKVETQVPIDIYEGNKHPYDGPRYRMINQQEVVEYCTKKVNLEY